MKQFIQTISLVALAALWQAQVFAAEDDDANDQPPKRQRQAGQFKGRRGDMRERMRRLATQYLEKLRQEDPEKYQELMALRNEDPFSFVRQMHELMQADGTLRRGNGQDREKPGQRDKQGPSDDSFGGSREGSRQDRPRRFGRQGGQGQSDDNRAGLRAGPRQGDMSEDGPGRFGRQGGQGQGQRQEKLFERLRQRDPETFERLRQLREDNPAEFRREIRQLYSEKLRAYGRAQFGKDPRYRELAKRYREAESDEDRERVKGELRQTVEASFDEQITRQEAMIKRLETQLTETRSKLDERRTRKKDICEKQLQLVLEKADKMQNGGMDTPNDRQGRSREDGDQTRGRPRHRPPPRDEIDDQPQ